MMLMVAVAISITRLYIEDLKGYSTQTAADSISDGVAVQMALNGGDYDDAVSAAESLMEQINEETPVNIVRVELDRDAFENDNQVRATVYTADYQASTDSAVNLAIRTSTTEFQKKYTSADVYNGGDFGIAYIRWAIDTANDDTHGYSMTSRYGPDYDCSSFVSYALRNSGWYSNFPVCSTHNLRQSLIDAGWEAYPFNYANYLNGSLELQPGDILLAERAGIGHTEIYLSGQTTIGAHSNYDGRTGDSSGREISTSTISSTYNWVLRDPNLQEKINA